MRKICVTLLAILLYPALAMAQNSIAKAVWQIRHGQYTEISVEKETDIDDDGKECVYEVYAYEMPKNSGKFKQLLEAFDADQSAAYSVMKRLQGVSGDKQSIGYGRNASKSITFGSYTDRNYYLLLFNDPADKLRRTCYELTWYAGKKSKNKDTWKVYITHIYGLNPKKMDKGQPKVTTTTTTTTITSDGTIIRYDRDTGNSVVYRPQKESATDADLKVNNAVDFINHFNDLRVEYVKAIEFAGKEQTFYADMIMKPVKKMLALCRNYSKLLSTQEQTSCANALDDMKTKSRDRGVQEMLDLARKYVRGL